MDEGQRQALARLVREDDGFRSAMNGATSAEETIRIASEHGIEVTVEDLTKPPPDELSATELDLAAGGGRIFPTVPWLAC